MLKIPFSELAGSESFVSVASSTGSDKSLNLSIQWLQNCNESHVSCSRKATTSPPFLPTRLIDIGIEESAITPRLCLRREIPLNSVYFTLSHCWGKTAPKTTLLRSNIEFMLREINFSQLPNTFQEALLVVRKLGGRFIWIDSLCIIQDSETDWLVESVSMCDVYSNSYCNICATAARDGSERMFRDREPLQIQQGWFQTARDEDNHCIIDDCAWKREVEDGILSSRAWVCQERLLSRRNLHFGSRQLFWECLHHEASETFPKGVPQLVAKGRSVKSRVKVLVHGIDKCRSGISFESGQIWEKIACCNRRNGKRSGSTHRGGYLAGVWEEHLLSGILRNARNYPADLSTFTQAPLEEQEFIAPSWSWASFDGEIDFPPRICRSRDIEQFPQILETHLDLAIDNPFGKVCGGYIKLKGDITSATYYLVRLTGWRYCNNPEIRFGQDGNEREGLGTTLIFSDFQDMTEIERQEICFLPVCRFFLGDCGWEVRGLILFPTNRARWEFQRCGMSIYATGKDHEALMSECRSFSREQKIESSEFGLQDDGKFIIKIF
ncbi:putative heterokaryon incompatibility protein [Botrytis fragariae]|uniref:Putative heterokaryon incompatibility protein n=1 Tax=Botrytis fragariae TaxID=1964551 RepID=A0A8H6EHC9_9HELO|nr:putative heterokaryon incompatibility protein [Botrytis fragariae]KAF5871935.1 putative heterokaryon incompatibility protein [Botrytis fragariae]